MYIVEYLKANGKTMTSIVNSDTELKSMVDSLTNLIIEGVASTYIIEVLS